MIETPVADICDRYGSGMRVLDRDWRAFTEVRRFAGPVRLVALQAADGVLASLLAGPGAGAVAVVAVAARDVAVFGDGMARAAEANGWAGVVIDGALRDVALVRPRRIGVLATAVRPGIERGGPAGAEVPRLRVGGALLEAGDWIVADEDGVVALDAERAARLGARAEAITAV